jgi:hypothetical protein
MEGIVMAKFLHPDTIAGQAALADIGVRFVSSDHEGEISGEHLEEFLSESERHVRTTFTAQPPSEDSHFDGMGAWHINNAQEAHSIVAGEGVMEFITQSGVVSVLVEQGDAVLIDKAEHRYLPLTEQTWLIRHGGESDFTFEATETGREPEQWLRP